MVVVDADEEAQIRRDSQIPPAPEEEIEAEAAGGAVEGIATAIPMRPKVPGPMRLLRPKKSQRRFRQPPTMQMTVKFALSVRLM